MFPRERASADIPLTNHSAASMLLAEQHTGPSIGS